MLKRILQRLTSGGTNDALFQPRMPDVEQPASLPTVFDQARSAAAGRPPALAGPQRHVVIVTPARLLMFHPCPVPGSMPVAQADGIKRMMSPDHQRNIAVIAYTELSAVSADVSKAIPFIGMLMGFAYIGHAVWVFEGHASALPYGCRDADVLLVDGGMIPHLAGEWQTLAARVMRRPEIYAHDRKTFALQPLRSR